MNFEDDFCHRTLQFHVWYFNVYLTCKKFLRAFCSQRVIWHLRVFTGHLTYLKYIKKAGYDFERRFIALFNNVLFFLECLEGFYGDQCNHKCKCKHGGICHHISGECKCIKPGWNGKFCEKGQQLQIFHLIHSSPCSCKLFPLSYYSKKCCGDSEADLGRLQHPRWSSL